MMFGLDHLGGARYSDLALREHPEGWAFRCFMNTFRDGLPLLEAVAKSGRAPLIGTHGVWDDDHHFGNFQFELAKREAKRFNQLAKRFPGIVFEYSPYCEHRLSANDAHNVMQECQHLAPKCRIVNTPEHGKGAVLPAWKNEVHGKGPALRGLYNFSFDGTPCVDSDIEEFKAIHSRCGVFYLWEPRFNGRWEDTDKTLRPQRKGWPDSKLIDSVIYLHRDRGKCMLPDKWTYKSHAENKGPNPQTGNMDQKAEKPCVIAPKKDSRIDLVAENGQAIGSLKYYGPFSGGGFRYYSPEWGYQLAEKARRIQGHSVCSVVFGGKKVGQINPAFRFGSFREE